MRPESETWYSTDKLKGFVNCFENLSSVEISARKSCKAFSRVSQFFENLSEVT